MKITGNRYRLVFAATVLEANVFLMSAYLWGPSHTPKWVGIPYIAILAISTILLVVGESMSKPAVR